MHFPGIHRVMIASLCLCGLPFADKCVERCFAGSSNCPCISQHWWNNLKGTRQGKHHTYSFIVKTIECSVATSCSHIRSLSYHRHPCKNRCSREIHNSMVFVHLSFFLKWNNVVFVDRHEAGSNSDGCLWSDECWCTEPDVLKCHVFIYATQKTKHAA